MKSNDPQGVGPLGRWPIFFGVPMAILGLLLVTTMRKGFRATAFGQDAEPYIIFFTPIIVGLLGYSLYKLLPRRLIIPLGIVGWAIGLSLIYWYFWFGPGAFGHHR
jgi:hypothetical protein